MSTLAIAIISILAPLAAGALAFVVKLRSDLSKVQAQQEMGRAQAPIPPPASARVAVELEALGSQIKTVQATLTEWEKWRWTSMETAIRESTAATRELIKLLGRLES